MSGMITMFCIGLPVLVSYWLSVLAFGTGADWHMSGMITIFGTGRPMLVFDVSAVLAYVGHDNDF